MPVFRHFVRQTVFDSAFSTPAQTDTILHSASQRDSSFHFNILQRQKTFFADPVLLSSITVGCVLLPEFQNTLIQKTMEQICRQNIFLGATYCSGFDLLTGTNTGKYLRFLFVRKRDLANKSQCALFT